MNERPSEPGIGVVLFIVLLLLVTPVALVAVGGVVFYSLRTRQPTVVYAAPGPLPAAAVPIAVKAVPPAPAMAAVPMQTATLKVADDGSFTFEGKPVERERLVETIVNWRFGQPSNFSVTIVAGPDTPYETVSRCMQACNDAGVPYRTQVEPKEPTAAETSAETGAAKPDDSTKPEDPTAATLAAPPAPGN